MFFSKICHIRSCPVNCRCFALQLPVSAFQCTTSVRSCSTTITRIKKSIYPRVYKVRLQQPDGSSYTMRYHEPRQLVRLPVDPNTLTEEEKQARLNRLKPEKEIEIHEFDDEETKIIQRSWKDFVASK